MAKAKLSFKTPLLPLSWVNVRGTGKLKKDATDDKTPENYNYTATVTYPDEATMNVDKAKFDKFWRDNKPQGAGKQSYEMFKPVMVPTLDKNGKEQKDSDDEIIKHHNGKYTLAAKTMTHWPDGTQNVIKLLGSNGKELVAGHPLEKGCGLGTEGILHCTVGINAFPGNMGLQVYLNGVQIKDSTYQEYVGGSEIEAEEIDDTPMDAEVKSGNPSEVPEV